MTNKEIKELNNICNELYFDIETTTTYHENQEESVVYTCDQARNLITSLGYTVGKVHHANGIGNNNEYPIIKRIEIDGYEYDITLGYLNYNSSIYSEKVYLYITDKDDNIFWKAKDYFDLFKG